MDLPALIGSLCLLIEGLAGFWLMESYHSSKFWHRHPEKKKFIKEHTAPLRRPSTQVTTPPQQYRLELGIELLVEIVIFTIEFSSEQMDMPHSFGVGLIFLLVGVGLLLRILYIVLFLFPWWSAVSRFGRVAVMTLIAFIVVFLLGSPVYKAWTKPWVHLSFRDDDDLTWWREQVITYDVSRLHDHLLNLDIPVPEEIPSFTVTDSENMVGHAVPPLYTEYLELRRAHLKDRPEATWQYLNYVLTRVFKDNSSDNRIISQSGLFQIAVREYLQKSFWRSADEDYSFAVVLLAIRNELGDKFTDRLVSHFARLEADIPGQIIDPDPKKSFLNGLKMADQDIESHMQHWEKIQKIVNHYKFDVTMKYDSTPQ